MKLVVTGLMNKQIAGELGVAEITVKKHRGRVMDKMRARSLAELVTISAALPMHGAILDGRHRTEREAADVLDLTTTQTGRRPTA